MDITLHEIGTIHTPYLAINAPDQPIADAPGDFWLTINPEYTAALKDLAGFQYIYVLYYLHQAASPGKLLTAAPWAPETEVGLFASRCAERPNPIGLSVVRVKAVEGNEITISGLDAYNGTPLLDIKPYMSFLDTKKDADNGWVDTLPDKEHTIAHILGLDHSHDHSHSHSHSHSHDHDHVHNHENVHPHRHEHKQK